MEAFAFLIDFIVHIDKHLLDLVAQYGTTVYLILFLIVFCETGLVVTPFLPGDSLLFAAGAIAGKGDMDLPFLMLLLIGAGVLGDTVNYAAGKWAGPEIFRKDTGRLLNKKHLAEAHVFYEKYGGKAIVLARFVPIVRTFAPFVAGIGRMRYAQFLAYNIVGAVAWVVLFVLAGYFFGNIEAVRSRFSLVILAIIVISVLPIVYELVKNRREKKFAK